MPSKAPAFSIITAAYNAEKTVVETIHTVLQQSFDDWEMVIVNDGSTDRTVERIAEIKDPRIRVVSQENKGLAGARNTGIQASKGKYLNFLDADDYLLPDALARLGRALDQHPEVCLAYGEGVVMDNKGKVYGKTSIMSPRPSGDVLEKLLQGNIILNAGVVAVRRETIEAVNLFDATVMRFEDWEIWCRLAAICRFLYIGKEPILNYRISPGSLLRTSFDDGGFIDKVVDKVFDNPEVVGKFNGSKIRRMRSNQIAHMYSIAATQCVREGLWGCARKHLLVCLRNRPLKLREWILMFFSIMQWVPPYIRDRIK